MAYGSPYNAVGGNMVPLYGSQGHPIFITGGSLTKSAMKIDEITGPGDEGSVKWCEGNYRYDFTLRGYHAAGIEASSVAYTHSTKTLVKAGAFASVTVGDQLYVSGGTNATPGLYEIATNADDDTVTLVTAPGTGDQTDFVLDGGPTLDDVVRGTVTIQLGNGQQATGTGIMEAVSGSAMWVGGGGIIPVQLRGRFNGTPTFSRPS
jgi:hypothetical protein